MVNAPRSVCRLLCGAGLVFPLAMACGDDAGGSPTATDNGTTDNGSETTQTAATDTDAPVENLPPPTPVLVSPSDGAVDVSANADLCWELAVDPNGDELRYRVFVDDIELSQGVGSEEQGHAGPCLEGLDFNPGQAFTWTVQAYETETPESQSEPATPWGFATLSESGGQIVFDDDFEDEDSAWTVEGDATAGAWIHGNPNGAANAGATSQPNNCDVGTGCFFTGQNPTAMPNDEDVVGGTTILVSPAFDLSGFATASVSLSRFFYKEIELQTGTLFRVELLLPNDEAQDGYDVIVLEQLESPGETASSNVWMPTEYAACSAPMVAGARLRVSATDLGHVYDDEGVTEAALDNVRVFGHPTSEICDGGLNAICDPNAANSCSSDYMCCPQGTVHTGVFRCTTPVRGLDYDTPPPGNSANGELGCHAPDLKVLDPTDTVLIDDITVGDAPGEPNYCVLLEGCVDGPGQRRLLRFDTTTPNQGSRDLVMGVPSNHPDLYHFSECHNHHHFDGYAYYELLDADDTVVATGHKQAFCLIDTDAWAPGFGAGDHWCGNQGISMGYQDVYGRFLDCQWIDITDVTPGEYTLHIEVNRPDPESGLPPLVERDYSNNEFFATVEIPVPE